MAYLSLYRKYRPQTFAQVAGQDHVVQTLQNALRLGHVANGYLFCGTRGVAKTTIARILAKCLNCIGPEGVLNAPQPEPCNACEFCRSIQAGQCVDVVEMDAASNRSVSDIAKLRESVQFGPMETRFKVYIVDEAHQLSSDAKDAFLKTLEEPPAHVVFILATTEAHAIPITIASRCQQFDFRRGSVAQIAEQCRRVLADEGVAMPDDAIALVARAAEGSYRDALSLLDQVLAYKREGITASDVAGALGTVEGDAIARALGAISSGDLAALFVQADALFLQGKDVRQFLKAMSSYVRDLVYVSAGGSAVGLMDSGAEASTLKATAKLFSPGALVRMLDALADADRQIRHSDQHRLLLEMTLLKLSAAQSAPDAAAPPSVAASTHGAGSRAPAPKTAMESARAAPAAAAPHSPKPTTIPPSAAPAVDEPRADDAIVAESTPMPSADLPEPADALRRLQASWGEVIHHIQVRSPAGVAVARDASPVAVDGFVVTLLFSNRANVVLLDNPRRRSVIENMINKALHVPEGTYRVKCIAPAEESSPPPTEPPRANSHFDGAQDAETADILDQLISVFGGKIIEEPG